VLKLNTVNKSLKIRDAVPHIERYTPPPPPPLPLQCIMNTLEIDTLLKKHPHSRPVFNGGGGGGGVYLSICGTASLLFRLLLTVFSF
jgi:hypothetical protein